MFKNERLRKRLQKPLLLLDEIFIYGKIIDLIKIKKIKF